MSLNTPSFYLHNIAFLYQADLDDAAETVLMEEFSPLGRGPGACALQESPLSTLLLISPVHRCDISSNLESWKIYASAWVFGHVIIVLTSKLIHLPSHTACRNPHSNCCTPHWNSVRLLFSRITLTSKKPWGKLCILLLYSLLCFMREKDQRKCTKAYSSSSQCEGRWEPLPCVLHTICKLVPYFYLLPSSLCFQSYLSLALHCLLVGTGWLLLALTGEPACSLTFLCQWRAKPQSSC